MNNYDNSLLEAVKNNDMEKIKELIKFPIDINIKDSYGWTPIMWASKNGNKDLVEILLSMGADTSIRNNDGQIPAVIAYLNNHNDIQKILSSTKKFSISNEYNNLSIKDEYDLVQSIFINGGINKFSWKKFLENYSQPILLGIKSYCKNGYGCSTRKKTDSSINLDCMIQCIKISYNTQNFNINKLRARDYLNNKQICDESNLFYNFALEDYQKSYLKKYEGKAPLINFVRASFKLCKLRFIQLHVTDRSYIPTVIENASKITESDIEIYKVLMESSNISEVVTKLQSSDAINLPIINENIIEEKYKILKKVLNESNCDYIDSLFKNIKTKYKKPNEDEVNKYIQEIKSRIVTDFDLIMFIIFQKSKNLSDALQRAENNNKISEMKVKITSQVIESSFEKITKILGEEKTQKYILSEMDKNIQQISLDNQVNEDNEETSIDIEIRDNKMSLIDNIDILDEIKKLIEDINKSDDFEDLLDYRIIKYRFLESKSPLEIADLISNLKLTSKVIPQLVTQINELRNISSYIDINELNDIVKNLDKEKKEFVNKLKAQINNTINNRITTILKQIKIKLIEKFSNETWIESINDIFDSD